jgi:hypothetical protein
MNEIGVSGKFPGKKPMAALPSPGSYSRFMQPCFPLLFLVDKGEGESIAY